VTASVALGTARHHASQVEDARAALEAVWTSTLSPPAFERETRRNVANVLAGVARQQMDAAALQVAADRLRAWLADLSPSHPRQSRWMEHQANARALAGDFDGAIEHYERAIRVAATATGAGSRMSHLWNELGVLANDAGRFALAIDALEHAIALAKPVLPPSEYALTLLNLGSVFDTIGDYERAEAAMREALSLGGDEWTAESRRRARGNLGRVLGAQRRFAEARALLEAALAEASPVDAPIEVLRLVQLDHLVGDAAAASRRLDALDAALVDHPLAAVLGRPSRRFRGRVALLAGDAATAVASAQALLPEYTSAYGETSFDADLIRIDLAEAQLGQGRPDAARATLTPVLPRVAAMVTPSETNRARAERIWAALSGSPLR
jgi:tetratricopeptide (TPR) repeat protein